MYNKGRKAVYLFFKLYLQEAKFTHIMNEKNGNSIVSRGKNCMVWGYVERKLIFRLYFCAF